MSSVDETSARRFQALTAPSPSGFFVALFVALSALNFQAWDKCLLDVLPAALVAIWARPAVAFVSVALSTDQG